MFRSTIVAMAAVVITSPIGAQGDHVPSDVTFNLRRSFLEELMTTGSTGHSVGARWKETLRMDQHSAVLVVSLAAILSSALVFLATRKGIRQWWIFVGCGIVAGDFPATFYLATAPDNVYLPLTEMYVDGTISGVVAGAVLTLLLRSRKRSAAA